MLLLTMLLLYNAATYTYTYIYMLLLHTMWFITKLLLYTMLSLLHAQMETCASSGSASTSAMPVTRCVEMGKYSRVPWLPSSLTGTWRTGGPSQTPGRDPIPNTTSNICLSFGVCVIFSAVSWVDFRGGIRRDWLCESMRNVEGIFWNERFEIHTEQWEWRKLFTPRTNCIFIGDGHALQESLRLRLSCLGNWLLINQSERTTRECCRGCSSRSFDPLKWEGFWGRCEDELKN